MELNADDDQGITPKPAAKKRVLEEITSPEQPALWEETTRLRRQLNHQLILVPLDDQNRLSAYCISGMTASALMTVISIPPVTLATQKSSKGSGKGEHL
jgi:hypothetical protein